MVKKKFIEIIKIILFSLTLAFCAVFFVESGLANAYPVLGPPSGYTRIPGLWLTQPIGQNFNVDANNIVGWAYGKPNHIIWNPWPSTGDIGAYDPTYVQILIEDADGGGWWQEIFGTNMPTDHRFLWTPNIAYIKDKLIAVDLLDMGGIAQNWDDYYYDRGYVYIDATPPSNPTKAYAYSDSSKNVVLTTGKWYTYPTPYFTWEASSSSDVNVYHAYLQTSAPNKELAWPSIPKDSRNFSPPSPLTATTTYKFYITTEDKATSEAVHPGNVSIPVNLFDYGFDSVAPDADISGSTVNYINSTSFIVSWEGNDHNGSGIGSYEIQYNDQGGPYMAWLATDSTSATFTGVNAHTYQFKVRATDKTLPVANLGSWSSAKSFVVDTAPPYSTVSGPTGTVSDLSPIVEWSGGDTVSGVQTYTIQYKDLTAGGDWTTFYNGSGTSMTFVYGVNTHAFCLRSRATDKAGNIEDWPASPYGDLTFTIEAGDAPTNLRITSLYNVSTPSFSWQAPLSSQGYSVAMDSSPLDSINCTQTNYTSASLLDGRHTFRVKSYNDENIWSGSVARDFIIDTHAPTVGGIIMDRIGNSGVSITGMASDEVEVAAVKYQILTSAGTTVTTWRNASGSFGSSSCAFSINETIKDDGTFKFKIKAIDEVSGEGVIETGSFTIDLTDPVITINSPFIQNAPGMTVADPLLNIDATLADGNGIDCASLEINGLDADSDYHFEKNYSTGGASPYRLKYRSAQEINEGEYNVIITAVSAGKAFSTALAITVFSGSVRTLTKPYSFPNPFKPGLDSITIRYELSRDSGVKLLIYNMAGKPVRTYAFSKGQNGGKAGTNNLVWDGRDNFGKAVANGPYYYFIIVDGKVIGKGEMAAFR